MKAIRVNVVAVMLAVLSAAKSENRTSLSHNNENILSEEDLIATNSVLPNQIFNDGKPYYAGKDPVSGQLDFAVKKTASIESAINEVLDLNEKVIVSGASPNIHDFLNLPVKYMPSNFVYPMVSSSYANLKFQGNNKNFVTNEKPSTAMAPTTDTKNDIVPMKNANLTQTILSSLIPSSSSSSSSSSPATLSTLSTTTKLMPVSPTASTLRTAMTATEKKFVTKYTTPVTTTTTSKSSLSRTAIASSTRMPTSLSPLLSPSPSLPPSSSPSPSSLPSIASPSAQTIRRENGSVAPLVSTTTPCSITHSRNGSELTKELCLKSTDVSTTPLQVEKERQQNPKSLTKPIQSLDSDEAMEFYHSSGEQMSDVRWNLGSPIMSPMPSPFTMPRPLEAFASHGLVMVGGNVTKTPADGQGGAHNSEYVSYQVQQPNVMQYHPAHGIVNNVVISAGEQSAAFVVGSQQQVDSSAANVKEGRLPVLTKEPSVQYGTVSNERISLLGRVNPQFPPGAAVAYRPMAATQDVHPGDGSHLFNTKPFHGDVHRGTPPTAPSPYLQLPLLDVNALPAEHRRPGPHENTAASSFPQRRRPLPQLGLYRPVAALSPYPQLPFMDVNIPLPPTQRRKSPHDVVSPLQIQRRWPQPPQTLMDAVESYNEHWPPVYPMLDSSISEVSTQKQQDSPMSATARVLFLDDDDASIEIVAVPDAANPTASAAINEHAQLPLSLQQLHYASSAGFPKGTRDDSKSFATQTHGNRQPPFSSANDAHNKVVFPGGMPLQRVVAPPPRMSPATISRSDGPQHRESNNRFLPPSHSPPLDHTNLSTLGTMNRPQVTLISHGYTTLGHNHGYGHGRPNAKISNNVGGNEKPPPNSLPFKQFPVASVQYLHAQSPQYRDPGTMISRHRTSHDEFRHDIVGAIDVSKLKTLRGPPQLSKLAALEKYEFPVNSPPQSPPMVLGQDSLPGIIDISKRVLTLQMLQSYNKVPTVRSNNGNDNGNGNDDFDGNELGATSPKDSLSSTVDNEILLRTDEKDPTLFDSRGLYVVYPVKDSHSNTVNDLNNSLPAIAHVREPVLVVRDGKPQSLQQQTMNHHHGIKEKLWYMAESAKKATPSMKAIFNDDDSAKFMAPFHPSVSLNSASSSPSSGWNILTESPPENIANGKVNIVRSNVSTVEDTTRSLDLDVFQPELQGGFQPLYSSGYIVEKVKGNHGQIATTVTSTTEHTTLDYFPTTTISTLKTKTTPTASSSTQNEKVSATLKMATSNDLHRAII